MKLRILLFGTLIGIIKTLDEFEDECSKTYSRALKILTLKKLVSTITHYRLRMKVRIAKFDLLIGIIKTLDEFKEAHTGTPSIAFTTNKLLKGITLHF